jgi:acetolactate synthase-1/2/3 large subunit
MSNKNTSANNHGDDHAQDHAQDHGGKLLVKQLEKFGIERVFCVPGESYLPVLDALHDSTIKTTLCRQEGGAAMMAEAWGKFSNLPGISFVTRGPGATNASAGVHVAQQDSTPMILFVGQVALKNLGRDAFQEVNYQAFFGGMAKAVFQIETTKDIPKVLKEAFEISLSGRMGPVVIALPEEVLTEDSKDHIEANFIHQETSITHSNIKIFKNLIEAANSPIVIAGGSGWDEASVAMLEAFAEKFQMPVACSFRRQMLFTHTHPHYAGDVGLGINPALKAEIENADLVILLGARMSEVASQDYTLLKIPRPKQKLIHVHPSKDELGKLYETDLAIEAKPAEFMETISDLTPNFTPNRAQHVTRLNQSYQTWSLPQKSEAKFVQMPSVMETLKHHLKPDALLTNGAGNYATWIHRFWQFGGYNTQLAPTSGSMGYGLPAAIAGKLKFADKDVVCFAGDGCFQMTCQEFGTACQEGAAILVMIIDNGIYGTIRMHQERHFPHRTSATELQNPDFAQIAAAYGAFSAKIEVTEDFEAALIEALRVTREEKRPALLHLKTDPQAITPNKTLDEIATGG